MPSLHVRPLLRAVLTTSLALLAACGSSSSTPPPSPSAPTLASVAPGSGPIAGGTAITLTGANFVTGATVTVGGASATGVAVNGATSIAATTPAHAAGAVDVVVTNPDGRSGTLASAFTYVAPAPVFALTSIAPTHGPTAGGTVVTLTGTAFRAGVGVEFGTSTASAVTVVNATTLTATSPAHGAGAVDVSVVDVDGTTKTLAGAFTFDPPATGPIPTVTGVSPASGPTAGGTSVVISGTNFVTGPSGTTVTIGGSAATATVTSATQITATTPAHAFGAVDVSIANPDGHAATLPGGFTFVAPAPTLTAVAPPTGHAGTAVALTGTGFLPNATVKLGGVNAAVLSLSADGKTLTVTAPAHGPGAVDVTVTNTDGQAAALTSSFTYVAPPTLTSLSAASGSTGGNEQVALAGSGFVNGVDAASSSTVSFGGAAATVTSVTGTTIILRTPVHAAGAVDVTVANPDGQSATLASAFTFNAPTGVPPPPVVTTLSVTSGPTAGGTAVQINGSGYTGGVTVSFGGVPGVNPVAHNIGDFVTVTTPVHAAGTVDVSVKDIFGQVVTKPGAFTFLGPVPTIATLNIHGAPPAGNTPVIVKGTNFDLASTVTFGGAAATNVVPDLVNGQLIVTTPPQPNAAVEFVDVVVRNPDGQTATSPNFHYGPLPVVTSFSANGATSPAVVAVHAGDVITINGANFTADTTGPKVGLQVQIGDKVTSATLTTKSPTQIVLAAPPNNPGTYPIVVTNFDGQFTVTTDRITYPGP